MEPGSPAVQADSLPSESPGKPNRHFDFDPRTGLGFLTSRTVVDKGVLFQATKLVIVCDTSNKKRGQMYRELWPHPLEPPLVSPVAFVPHLESLLNRSPLPRPLPTSGGGHRLGAAALAGPRHSLLFHSGLRGPCWPL